MFAYSWASTAGSKGPQEPLLPLGGEFATTEHHQPASSLCRAVLHMGVAVTAILAALGIVLSTLPQHHSALDLAALVVPIYTTTVACLQLYFFEWHMQEARPLALVAASAAALLAPTVHAGLGLQGEGLLVRCAVLVVEASIAVMTYFCLVRGPGWKVQAGALRGKVYVITGCNTGIGLETARAVANAGATVVFACRSESRAKAAMARLLAESAGSVAEGSLRFVACNLASLHSVRACAEQLRQEGLIPEVLVLNAGLMLHARQLSEDGFDMMFAANHFGHFALVNLLLPDMLAAEKRGMQPRIVVVASSMSYRPDHLDFSEVAIVSGEAEQKAFLEKPFSLFPHYGQTKLANVLFAAELAQRLHRHGSCIPVNSLHPGQIASTEMNRDILSPIVKRLNSLLEPLSSLAFKTSKQGSFCTLFLATAPQLATAKDVSGAFFVRLARAPLSSAMKDEAASKQLWELSERLTGTSAGI